MLGKESIVMFYSLNVFIAFVQEQCKKWTAVIVGHCQVRISIKLSESCIDKQLDISVVCKK